jgi:hypothetical protein
MATATPHKSENGATTAKPKVAKEAPVITRMEIPQLEIKQAVLRVQGISPLIMHKWSEKAEEMLAGVVTGAPKAQRGNVVPEESWRDAAYVISGKEDMEDWKPGKYYFPAAAFKHAFLYGCAQIKDVKNFPKSQATGWVYIDNDPVLEFESVDLRRDIGRKPVQPIYRPQFNNWGCELFIGYNARAISIEQIVSLFDLGGFSGGIGEWRPSSPINKSGSFGRFRIPSIVSS